MIKRALSPIWSIAFKLFGFGMPFINLALPVMSPAEIHSAKDLRAVHVGQIAVVEWGFYVGTQFRITHAALSLFPWVRVLIMKGLKKLRLAAEPYRYIPIRSQTPIIPMSSCSRMWQWNMVMPSKSLTGTSSLAKPSLDIRTVSLQAGSEAYGV